MELLRSLGRRVWIFNFSYFDMLFLVFFLNILVHFFIILEMHGIMSFEAWLAKFTSNDVGMRERAIPLAATTRKEYGRIKGTLWYFPYSVLRLHFLFFKFYILSSSRLPLPTFFKPKGTLGMGAR